MFPKKERKHLWKFKSIRQNKLTVLTQVISELWKMFLLSSVVDISRKMDYSYSTSKCKYNLILREIFFPCLLSNSLTIQEKILSTIKKPNCLKIFSYLLWGLLFFDKEWWISSNISSLRKTNKKQRNKVLEQTNR